MKRTLAIAFAFGAGFALAGLSGLALMSWWSGRPLPWSSSAVTASFEAADTEGAENKVVLFYLLENNTEKDFRIESAADVRLLLRLQRQGALMPENSNGLLSAAELPLFVPAGQRVRLTIHLGLPYTGSVALSQGRSKADREQNETAVASFVQEAMPNLGGFMLFHEPTRYQIDLSNGWKKP